MTDNTLTTEQTQRSLWIGDLGPWMDEAFLVNAFASTNALLSVKLIKNRITGMSEGYGFLEFNSHESAATVLNIYSGQVLPGTSTMCKLNWAACGAGKVNEIEEGIDYAVFVGDLAPDVGDRILLDYFRQFYPSVRSAKVIIDSLTGRSKGYGFVRFGMEVERDAALIAMNGHYLSNRPIRVNLATAKKLSSSTNVSIVQSPHPSDYDPTNTTLFIGGLSPAVTEDQLRSIFGHFGDIIYVKIPQGKGCGFVQFVLRTAAEAALQAMSGQILGGSAIRISWGRSSSRAANQIVAAGLAGMLPTHFDPAAAAVQQYHLQQQLARLGGRDPFTFQMLAGQQIQTSSSYPQVDPSNHHSYSNGGAAAHQLLGLSNFGAVGASPSVTSGDDVFLGADSTSSKEMLENRRPHSPPDDTNNAVHEKKRVSPVLAAGTHLLASMYF